MCIRRIIDFMLLIFWQWISFIATKFSWWTYKNTICLAIKKKMMFFNVLKNIFPILLSSTHEMKTANKMLLVINK